MSSPWKIDGFFGIFSLSASALYFVSISLPSVGTRGAEDPGRDLSSAAPVSRGRVGHFAGGERGEQGDAQGESIIC